MYLSKTLSVVSFFSALLIGVGAAWMVGVWGGAAGVAPVVVNPAVMRGLSCPGRFKVQRARGEDLRGSWRGTWGYDSAPSVIDIDRVDGDKFYGTLRKEGAVIAIEGKYDRETGKLSFRETRVVKLGPDMSEWSLGKDTGSLSPDGLTISGTGVDQWGTYGWALAKD